VTAARIDGPLSATTEGGSLQLDGLAGPLRADTGGGPLLGQDIAAATATASTGGGLARIVFSAAPDTVMVSTGGGPVMLTVPGGPYALTAGSDGGPQWVGIATDPAAHRLITVTSGGGALRIEPPTGRLPVRPAKFVWPRELDAQAVWSGRNAAGNGGRQDSRFLRACRACGTALAALRSGASLRLRQAGRTSREAELGQQRRIAERDDAADARSRHGKHDHAVPLVRAVGSPAVDDLVANGQPHQLGPGEQPEKVAQTMNRCR
jgi:hypothetical protein